MGAVKPQRGVDTIRHWPEIRLTLAEFRALPEYSCSLPTGQLDGKRWRRLDGSHDPSCPKWREVWMVCEYRVYPPDNQFSDGSVEIRYYRPVIIGCVAASRVVGEQLSLELRS